MRNFRFLRFASRFFVVAAILPLIAHAHPGHDDHDLTWDLGHLAAHPLATLVCFALIGGTTWFAARLLRAHTSTPAVSQAKREPAAD